MRKKTSTARVTGSAAALDNPAPIVLVVNESESAEELERALTTFDVDADLAAIIPMPATIPAAIRAKITKALAERFAFVDDLDVWLHAPNEALGGDDPFKRVAEGDGIAVLKALGDGGCDADLDALIAGMESAPSRLRLVK